MRWVNVNSETYLEPCQTSKMELFAKIINGFLVVDCIRKTPHLRCLAGFGIRLWNCAVIMTEPWDINVMVSFSITRFFIGNAFFQLSIA